MFWVGLCLHSQVAQNPAEEGIGVLEVSLEGWFSANPLFGGGEEYVDALSIHQIYDGYQHRGITIVDA
jgi:hypothetical protein